MNILRVAIVVPCLNEAGSLLQTCASLGFGTGQNPPSRSVLVLVDNGSTDESVAVAQTIITNSMPGAVHLVVEPERGYVPPRRRGNLVVAAIAAEQGINPSQMLVLQADADTTYSNDYVDQVRLIAEREEPSALFQACTRYPASFAATQRNYIDLCERIDGEFEALLLDHPDQIIIDDKAAGYLLSDYLKWGGHEREFRANGDEIYSETTRLFMKAKTYGSRIVPVDTAWAEHSVRRVLSQPAFDLATAGFPREKEWQEFWGQRTEHVKSIDHLLAAENANLVHMALELRRKHLLALFGLLPVHVARSLGRITILDNVPQIAQSSLPMRHAESLRTAPGIFIEDALRSVSLLAS